MHQMGFVTNYQCVITRNEHVQTTGKEILKLPRGKQKKCRDNVKYSKHQIRNSTQRLPQKIYYQLLEK